MKDPLGTWHFKSPELNYFGMWHALHTSIFGTVDVPSKFCLGTYINPVAVNRSSHAMPLGLGYRRINHSMDFTVSRFMGWN